MTKPTQVVVTAILAVFGSTHAIAASDPKGIWLDDSGRGAVEIKPCGGALCGYVVAVKNASDQKGCGKQIIGDAQAASGGVWDSGWIYSPERRKNYDVEIKPLNDGTLRVVGYAGTKLFSRTMIWRPAPADLQRCDGAATAPAPAAKRPAADIAADATSKPVATETAAVQPPLAKTEPAAKPPAAPFDQSATPAKQTAAPPQPQPTTAKPVEPPKTAQPPAVATEPQTAETDDDEGGGEKPGKHTSRSRGGLKLGDIDLDKVITRTSTGKCKIDLPFVKVSFKCED